ncbi:ricin-type beta-trefoil lectin domain protein [Streptomyces sp. C10-9-1]|uniref:ricin-type beta-trefoil lectin domain protein n=1 Tax=Streptomyces sp. C10-9-1 TaxID=1859285 RepID=UPI003D726BB8
MQHPSTPVSVPHEQAGSASGPSDAELAAALQTAAADRPATYPVAALLSRHWQPLFDYAALCAPSAQAASMLATAAFAQLTDRLARGGAAGAVRPHLLVAARHLAGAWSSDPRAAALVPGLSAPEPPSEERQLASWAFQAMPVEDQVLLWHVETEAEGISVPAALLGADPREASARLVQAREQFRQTCVRTHREHAPTADCRHYNRLLDISLRRGETLIPDIQVHLSECAYCRYAAEQLRQSDGRLGPLLAEALLGGAAGPYLASRPGRRRQARLRGDAADGGAAPPGAPRGRHSRSGRARAAVPGLVDRGRRAAVERTGATVLGLVAVTAVLAAALVAVLSSDDSEHGGSAAPGGEPPATAPGTAEPRPSATSAGRQTGPLTIVLRGVEAELCVDFAGGRATADADVLMAACSSTPSQRWVYETDGRLRSAQAPGLCLNSRGLNGIVVATNCTARTAPEGPDTRYDLTIQGQLVPRWNENLAVLPAATDPGSPLVVKVRDDSPGQAWATTAPHSGSTALGRTDRAAALRPVHHAP